MPVAAMPMAAMTFASAPMAMVANQAPTFSLQAVPQAAAAPKSSCGGDGSMSAFEQAMLKAIVERAVPSNSSAGGSAAPSAAPAASMDVKLSQLEQRIDRLTERVTNILEIHEGKIRSLEGK
jgi:hypothetical protein